MNKQDSDRTDLDDSYYTPQIYRNGRAQQRGAVRRRTNFARFAICFSCGGFPIS